MESSSKIKIVFGIVLPIIVILFLAILSSTSSGLEVKKQKISSIKFSEYQDKQESFKINIFNLTIKNGAIIPVKYQFPTTVVCLVDNTNTRYIDLPMEYSAGDVSPYYGSSNPFGYTNYYGYNFPSVELSTNSEKLIQFYVNINVYSNFDYNSNQTILSYAGVNDIYNFDKLIIVSGESKNNYRSCYSLTNDEKNSAEFIPLLA